MCLPNQTSSGTGLRSIVGIGAVMLIACLAGPILAGAAGAIGVGLLAGAGAAAFALALCALAPAALIAWRRRAATRQHGVEG